MLTPAETRYWPTDLETAALDWLVRRMRHMIEVAVATPQIIIYTDQFATTNIVKQTKLSSNSTAKLNLRLVRASTYLSQFMLNVRHKPGKQHVVPGALSRMLVQCLVSHESARSPAGRKHSEHGLPRHSRRNVRRLQNTVTGCLQRKQTLS